MANGRCHLIGVQLRTFVLCHFQFASARGDPSASCQRSWNCALWKNKLASEIFVNKTTHRIQNWTGPGSKPGFPVLTEELVNKQAELRRCSRNVFTESRDIFDHSILASANHCCCYKHQQIVTRSVFQKKSLEGSLQLGGLAHELCQIHSSADISIVSDAHGIRAAWHAALRRPV